MMFVINITIINVFEAAFLLLGQNTYLYYYNTIFAQNSSPIHP